MIPAIQQQITFITCSDLDRSAQFYETLFAFEMVLDQGNCRIFRTVQHSFWDYAKHVLRSSSSKT